MRLASAVRVTLSTTLTTIQNRRPLPAQPLPPPPPPNTIMPDSSGRWTGRLRPPGPLVSSMDPRSLWLIKERRVYTRADVPRKGGHQAFLDYSPECVEGEFSEVRRRDLK
jgi:hypothetical protein